ncbi:heterokaryon incompatibility protein-domain-containing protein [Astrocystis sublimbata]|nr:heterokaryon incompatibility protein-domain-containing protein [Astrocystis sublimbata]
MQADRHVYSTLPKGGVRLLRFISGAEVKNLESSIRYNGRDMRITPVLEEALQDLRKLDRGDIDWIWIDQIYIDQANALEHGSQVDMMKAIYRTSERTIIWLGTSIPGVEAIDVLLEQLSHLYKQDVDPSGTRKRRRYTAEEYMTIDLP